MLTIGDVGREIVTFGAREGASCDLVSWGPWCDSGGAGLRQLENRRPLAGKGVARVECGRIMAGRVWGS